MRTFMILGSVLLAAAAPATTDKVPAAIDAGPAVSCIQTSRVRSTEVRSDQVIDFVMSDGKVYRNTLPYACPQLGFEQRFVHKSTINQYCSVDTITVLQSPGLTRGPTCGLGEFQPVKLVKQSAPKAK